NDTATTEIYTLSLHDALPICGEARAALGGAKRQVMLHPIAGEHLGRAVVHVDRAGDDNGALRIEKPVALVLRDGQMVGDDMELLARHLEHGARIKVLHMRSPWRGRGVSRFSCSNDRARRRSCQTRAR